MPLWARSWQLGWRFHRLRWQRRQKRAKTTTPTRMKSKTKGVVCQHKSFKYLRRIYLSCDSVAPPPAATRSQSSAAQVSPAPQHLVRAGRHEGGACASSPRAPRTVAHTHARCAPAGREDGWLNTPRLCAQVPKANKHRSTTRTAMVATAPASVVPPAEPNGATK